MPAYITGAARPKLCRCNTTAGRWRWGLYSSTYLTYGYGQNISKSINLGTFRFHDSQTTKGEICLVSKRLVAFNSRYQ